MAKCSGSRAADTMPYLVLTPAKNIAPSARERGVCQHHKVGAVEVQNTSAVYRHHDKHQEDQKKPFMACLWQSEAWECRLVA